MSPADLSVERATLDHVALSVGDLDAMTGFYERLGFRAESPPVLLDGAIRTVLLRTPGGTGLELTQVDSSRGSPPAHDPIDAAERRGLFHFALHVRDLSDTLSTLRAAGARLVSSPAGTARGDRCFAYVADPEGNLIELLASSAGEERSHRRTADRRRRKRSMTLSSVSPAM